MGSLHLDVFTQPRPNADQSRVRGDLLMDPKRVSRTGGDCHEDCAQA